MKYKDLIKKLQPYAEKEVIIFAAYLEDYDEVSFYLSREEEPICIITQYYGKKAKWGKE